MKSLLATTIGILTTIVYAAIAEILKLPTVQFSGTTSPSIVCGGFLMFTNAAGIQNLFLVFPSGTVNNVDWFQFQ